MIIHRLEHVKMRDQVVVFDRVFRVLIPILLWPSLVVGMLFLGNKMDAPAWLFLIGGPLCTVVVGVYLTYRIYIKAMIFRKKTLEKARTIDNFTKESVEYADIIKDLYVAFDLDGGGELDAREMRQLLTYLFKDAPRTAISKAMQEVVVPAAGTDEVLDMATFYDVWEPATRVVKDFDAAKERLRYRKSDTGSHLIFEETTSALSKEEADPGSKKPPELTVGPSAPKGLVRASNMQPAESVEETKVQRRTRRRSMAKNGGRDGSPQNSPRTKTKEPKYVSEEPEEPREPAFGPGTVSAVDV
jgi:hypothetical protein